MKKIQLWGLTEAELAAECKMQGLPAFRGKQIFGWLQQKNVADFAAMTNLPKKLIVELNEWADITLPEIIREQQSADGQTIKLLLDFGENILVEIVLMVYEREHARNRRTICISTQAGCAMGCKFCATGINGLERNLTAAEIVAQVIVGNRWCRDHGLEGISNVVYMGMGEPLANFDNVVQSIAVLNQTNGLNIGQRKMTVSTCGLVPQIRKLADLQLQIGLAVSLHAPTDEIRSRLMPVNDRYKIAELLAACDYYAEQTGRRISYEYALLKNVNDSPNFAHLLGRLLKGRLAHVNLIPVNYVKETGFYPADIESIRQFSEIVESYNVETTKREKKGSDIDAACGQLRKRVKDNQPICDEYRDDGGV